MKQIKRQNNLEAIGNFIFLIAIFSILAVAFLLTIQTGIKKWEKMECLEWQEQSEIYPNFYWTDWQIEMCENY